MGDRHLRRIAEVRAGRGASKVGYPTGIRELEVVRTLPLAPSMLRLTLGGPGAAGFQSHVPIEHVRLIFPDPGTGEPRLPERDGDRLRWPRPLPPSREYTVRRHDPGAGEIDIDVVLHPGGLASGWAAQAAPRDRIPVAGPPGGFVVPDCYDRYLLAGDETALPAIARWLERMPHDAAGWAFVEVADASERIRLEHPDGVELRWLHRDGGPSPLAEEVRAIRPRRGQSLYAWIAGEAGRVGALREWARDELGLAPADRRVTGYWKRGVADFDDDEH